MKTSVIDIGSNSVRLAMFADGKTLYKDVATTRLGGGVSLNGRLDGEAVERTAQAVAQFVTRAQSEDAQKIYAFATAAVRSAKNGETFVNRVYELCGVAVDVISGEREAAAGLLGALKGADGGIIDVGGASTEVTVQRGGATIYSKSADIGTVRLNDLAGRDRNQLEKVIADKLRDYPTAAFENLDMFSIGGTATTIAAVKHGLKVYNPQITDGTVITFEEIISMADRLINMSVEEVRKLSGMEPRRADIIGGGCLLLGRVMEFFKVRKITVSESDNLEGYLYLKENGF